MNDAAERWRAEGFAALKTEFNKGHDHFGTFLGPFLYRRDGDAHELMIQVEDRHCNMNMVAHGGFMAAMTDMVCGVSSYFHFEEPRPGIVTVGLSHEFLAAPPLGCWLRGRGTIRRQGRSMIFVDCEFSVDGELAGLSRCIMKILP